MPPSKSKSEQLFFELFSASTEEDIDTVIAHYPNIVSSSQSWRPLGDNDNNMSIIQNQQGHPAAALVEKLTNAIDAVLMRHALAAGIDPKGKEAPNTMNEAVHRFLGSKVWSGKGRHHEQAYDIQVLADGPKGHPCLLIYDNGEGQHPDDFPTTFLSLVRGNKKDIPFVQGLYNMGGTGAIVFCGRRKYQLIGSRRYDGSGDFGFTLIRRHPLSDLEERTKASAWYEYLVIDGKIPRFSVSKPLDLGLHGRQFTTGSIIKLYAYQLPSGLRGNIAQELYQSVTEFLIEPALPIWVADSRSRYPDTVVLERTLVGLRRVLEQKTNKLVERELSFIKETQDGTLAVDCFVFKPVVGEKDAKQARESLRRQFFFNGGAVLFAVNGQVHGSWNTQFISQSLGMPLLKDQLLILVDCTQLRAEFRNDLFMASRDRLANSEQSQQLRDTLKSLLADSELKQIHELRRQSLGLPTGAANNTIKSYIKSLNLDSEIQRVLSGQLDIDEVVKAGRQGQGQGQSSGRRGDKRSPSGGGAKDEQPFVGRRFPSFFRLARPAGRQESTPAARIPKGGKKSVKFNTDVEDHYFTRSKQPGSLTLTLISLRQGEKSKAKNRGGDRRKPPYDVSRLFHVEPSDSESGEIRIQLEATDELDVGDEVQVAATLKGELTDFDEFFWVRIVEPQPRTGGSADGMTGLPQAVIVGRELRDGIETTWDQVAAVISRNFDENAIVYPMMTNDRAEVIYINIDSRVLAEHKAGRSHATEDLLRLLDKHYIATMYLHALLICGGMTLQGYSMTKPDSRQIDRSENVDLGEFVADLFSDGYAEFLVRFGFRPQNLEALDE
jgi:hypothetical protein